MSELEILGNIEEVLSRIHISLVVISTMIGLIYETILDIVMRMGMVQ